MKDGTDDQGMCAESMATKQRKGSEIKPQREVRIDDNVGGRSNSRKIKQSKNGINNLPNNNRYGEGYPSSPTKMREGMLKVSRKN